ncbi:MAG TPA: hypothetical protein VE934_06045 [Polaromonas sp.]|uniref:COG4648 family protein n=1 Tax=Polaromonas sp. TaxID=1869339 RepID=UPI002D734BCB|nr:hypothetical protein [Polaromonas sp.]HYW56498.1 hypothetical protein [Polaromonas sp.]
MIAAFCVAYPVLAHLASADPYPDLFAAAVAMAPLLAVAAVLAWRSPYRVAMLALCLAGCVAIYATSGWLVKHFNWVFLLQHAGMQALLAMAFGSTLRPGQVPMVSRFAAIVHGELSPALGRYTRQVTWAWTIYFVIMTALSLLLFWLAPIVVWSAFANLLNFPLLVLMFGGEYLARFWALEPADRTGPLEAIRAYRQSNSRGQPPAA